MNKGSLIVNNNSHSSSQNDRIINLWIVTSVEDQNIVYMHREKCYKYPHTYIVISMTYQWGLGYLNSIYYRRYKTPTKRERPRYETKLHLMVIILFWQSEMYGVSLHCHNTQFHSDPRVVIPGKVPSMGQMDLFKNPWYSIGLFTKENPLKQLHNKCKHEWTMNVIPSPLSMK